ncbi:hypothetical protein C3B44_11020 [Corynebacterium yudongzhengii]|uniref:Metallopeptidase family protein n=1 Tax=Corynebacterium yudongzhengii TaxID=2080740 RepID=A0A2U1T851_9CORY|nr:metallopeptidase family protein [Corynebacterium yudongzhengii]AWB82795.1 hypothetical protein C3B44_11020 [Corynebacterium yudongzhengii]PWC02145.1 hypothetical protein DF222_03375 [Corynebacterium yudongzhengii]
MYRVSDEEFDSLVNDALDTVPAHVVERMGNVVVLVRPYHEEEPSTLGLYEGVPLTERTFDHTGYLPDAIFLYKEALEQLATTYEELAHEVRVTLFHEIGHYFGIEEDRLHELGWG